MPRILPAMVSIAVVLLGADRAAEAAVTPEQRRELLTVNQDLRKAGGLLRRKRIEQAEKLIDSAEQRLNRVVQEAELSNKVPVIARLRKGIGRQRAFIQKIKDAGNRPGQGRGVSFVEDVAPILHEHCLTCHSETPEGNLRLDSFAGIKKGGRNSPVLIPGNAGRSLLMKRLTAPPKQRMPKNGPPLPKEQIQTIAKWINQGAGFDGEDESASLSSYVKTKDDAPDNEPKIPVPKPDGDETVSFVEDVAPFMVNICGRCHRGNNPRGGLSVETYAKLWRGGQSGQVLVPEKPKESRLFRLVAGLDTPQMPQGQARLTRKNFDDLKTWIAEGAAYDGPSATTPLRELVPTEEEKRAAELAAMSSEEFIELRRDRTRDMWERVLPKEEPQSLETQNFLLLGNVSPERLKQLSQWAEDHLATLRETFDVEEQPLWKGKLAVFVFKERFGYEEFNLMIHDRRPPAEMTGHFTVVPTHEDAHVALQDTGADSSAELPRMKTNLIDHLTGAFLQRTGRDLPDWVVRGTGLVLAERDDGENSYLSGHRRRALNSLKMLQKPEQMFQDGTFSPAGVAAVGYTLVEFLWTKSSSVKFRRFVERLQEGADVAAALQDVYGVEMKQLAQAYLKHLR